MWRDDSVTVALVALIKRRLRIAAHPRSEVLLWSFVPSGFLASLLNPGSMANTYLPIRAFVEREGELDAQSWLLAEIATIEIMSYTRIRQAAS